MHIDLKVAAIGASAAIFGALLSAVLPSMIAGNDGQQLVVNVPSFQLSDEQITSLAEQITIAAEASSDVKNARIEELNLLLNAICVTGGLSLELQLDDFGSELFLRTPVVEWFSSSTDHAKEAYLDAFSCFLQTASSLVPRIDELTSGDP